MTLNRRDFLQQNEQTLRVGFIGLGIMGQPIARHLLKTGIRDGAGHSLSIVDAEAFVSP
ncbi:hypothetical protein FKW15_12845 [Acetobacter sp. DmW_125133]|nr:hypothetical protein FKW22_14025 [Acetobacter sp. DmW_125124]KAA8393731.1 hypothetical protein FKW20_14910 [Acetobacter sp. DmW_125127]KAA8394372.1 hypothetical protein FKW19_12695 [Acetobacter sp. DmW_125128]KAA8402107.1 hypothetical protein FKW32_14500 [Acetobacter sp. DmW_125132]KAA8402227.1 hypothetical protein FKW15_12845 [Acetobacter sp. DmW_125133]KAA8403478.1 hypothetical protein FKW24_11165 [Acetobacter sp. DmW_125134]KAA8410888.1 hypothetical protein FKW18_11315 [Acetobacter sp. 